MKTPPFIKTSPLFAGKTPDSDIFCLGETAARRGIRNNGVIQYTDKSDVWEKKRGKAWIGDQMGAKITRIDEMIKELNSIGEKIRETGENIRFDDLFPPSFMKRHTEFDSIDELFEKSPFSFESQEDFEKIPPSQLNAYIRRTTRFSTWKKMMERAAENYFTKTFE